MDEQLSKKLNNCGIKKSVIEAENGMPKNSLSGMMNGTRPTPEKWHDKLWKYIYTLEGKIIPAPDAPLIEQVNKVVEEKFIPEPNPENMDEFGYSNDPLFGLNIIQHYCKEKNIPYKELVDFHRKMSDPEIVCLTKLELSKKETDSYNEGLKKGWERAKEKDEKPEPPKGYSRRFNKLGF